MFSKEINSHADPSEPRNEEKNSAETPTPEPTAGRKTYFGKVVEAAAGIGVFTFSVAVFYRVRELLAAFLLFSVVFGVVALAFLILWLVERGSHEAAVRIEAHMAHIPTQRIVAPSRAQVAPIHRTPPWN